MNLDERAQRARTALLDTAAQLEHRQIIERGACEASARRPRPGGLLAVVVAGAVLAAGALVLLIRGDGTESLETAVAPTEFGDGTLSRDDRLLAATVSVTGDVVLVTGSEQEPRGLNIRVDEGELVVDDPFVAGPRWLTDGRTIEYVARRDGALRVVRVDVHSGRSVSEEYWDDTEESALPLSAADSGDRASSLLTMRASDGTSVRVIEREGELLWWFATLSDTRGPDVEPVGTLDLLAPTPDGLLVRTASGIAMRRGDQSLEEIDLAGRSSREITAAAYAPGPSLLLGTAEGSVVAGARTIQVAEGEPVTILAWSEALTGFVAETSDGIGRRLHHCAIDTGECFELDVGVLGPGALVRGVRAQLSPENYPGVWPEATQDGADNIQGRQAPWRLRPDTVAARFAEEVLGWSAPIIGEERRLFFPWMSSVTVEREPAGPSATVTVGQLAAQGAWVVTGVRSAPLRFASGSDQLVLSVEFEPLEAARRTVIFTVNGVRTQFIADRSEVDFDQLTFSPEGGVSLPANALVLLEDEDGQVFSAFSASYNTGTPDLVTG